MESKVLHDELCPNPGCRAVGTLTLKVQLVADPIGKSALAGVQLKTTAAYRPVLTCSSCELLLIGEIRDGHAEFSSYKLR